jgi:glycerol uptake facilitator-like aquaporin
MSRCRRAGAEALGTALLLVAVVGSGIMGERLAGGNAALILLANSLATGAALYVLITLLIPVSGAHFNPAVSLCLAARGLLPWRELPTYLLAQCAGAVLGVWAAHAMFELEILQAGSRVRTGPAQWFSEGLASFGLLLTIRMALVHARRELALLVALYITGAYWFTASTSFANPAVTLARALSDTFAGIAPADAGGFILAQLLGAAAGAWLAERLSPPESPAVGP